MYTKNFEMYNHSFWYPHWLETSIADT